MKRRIEKIIVGTMLLLPLSLTATTVSAGPSAPLAFYAIDGCRVLDTRFWAWDGVGFNKSLTGTAIPVPSKSALDISFTDFVVGDIQLQGGSADGCPDTGVESDIVAWAVTLSAVPPGSPGYATLVGWDFEFVNWITPTPVGEFDLTDDDVDNPLPTAQNFTTYEPGVFRASTSILYDFAADLISNTTTVKACDVANLVDPQECDFDVRLYTSAEGHYIIDVVGFYKEIIPEL